MISAATLRRISDWLACEGVYNCRVEVDGTSYRVNMSGGFWAAADHDSIYPELDAPEWLVEIIRSEAQKPP